MFVCGMCVWGVWCVWGVCGVCGVCEMCVCGVCVCEMCVCGVCVCGVFAWRDDFAGTNGSPGVPLILLVHGIRKCDCANVL